MEPPLENKSILIISAFDYLSWVFMQDGATIKPASFWDKNSTEIDQPIDLNIDGNSP